MTEFLALLDALFTEQQQIALAIITIGVIAVTEVFKHVYFGFYPERRKSRKAAILWLAAFTFGLIGGIIGYFVGEPPQPLWFWVFTGFSAGAGAIGIFKLFIEWLPMLKQRLFTSN